MIKGTAKMEFGSGDILMISALRDGVGALCCVNREPHKIGDVESVSEKWNCDESDAILTFTKTESIDAVIESLNDIKSMMNGTHPSENIRITKGKLDFDGFINKGVLK